MTLTDGSRVTEIAQKFALLLPTMDERQTRLWLAAEATALGRGGLAAVTTATGVLRKRIGMGIRELEQMARNPPQEPPAAQRIRSPGAGRKKLTYKDATLVDDLEALVAPETRGDPESLLKLPTSCARWATASAGRRSVSCCTSLATACSRCRKLAKARRIQIATPSSGTSTAKPASFKLEASR